MLAVRTGLEPATLAVTGRYSNQLNYRTKFPTLKVMTTVILKEIVQRFSCKAWANIIQIFFTAQAEDKKY